MPSARYRIRQHRSALALAGIEIEEAGQSTTAYPPPGTLARAWWASRRLARISANLLALRNCDCSFIQREFISKYRTLERLTPGSRIFDVDDAIHLLRGGTAARALARMSDRVIVGNAYLADWYSQWNANVTVIPTAVDHYRYHPEPALRADDTEMRIGWIGTSDNHWHLHHVDLALSFYFEKFPRHRLFVVSDRAPALKHVNPLNLQFQPWSAETDVADINRMHIGIMPLVDTEWTRGKCSFKMLQYMSCGVPVVASPVGTNNEVFALGNVGFSASDANGWVSALEALALSNSLREKAGSSGRSVIERYFSAEIIAADIARQIKALF